MSNKYTPIFESEFDAIFPAERGWEKVTSGFMKEVVYQKFLKSKPDVVIKVYSSISQKDGISRECGGDAIRVCAVNVRLDKGVAKTTRINRVGAWQQRLKDRVIEVWNVAKN